MVKQIKSRERVREHGEVFTAQREVNAMIDLVSNEAQKIDSTFLEPACGNGNFLAEILQRKLKTVTKEAGDNSANYEYLATRAVASVYGMDIQEDNVIESRERLLNSVLIAFRRLFGKDPTHICQDSIRFILSQNIQCGNTLTYKAQNDEPLMITKWGFDDGNGLTIQIYDYADMVSSSGTCGPKHSLPRIPYYLLPAIVK